MPSDHGFRLDGKQRGSPAAPKKARATPAEFDQRNSNAVDGHDWTFGEPRADVSEQKSQHAALRESEIFAESKKRARK
jgi:hypothetical protein